MNTTKKLNFEPEKMKQIISSKIINEYDYSKPYNYYSDKYRYLSNETTFKHLRYKPNQLAGFYLVCFKTAFENEYFGHAMIEGATDEYILLSLFETKIIKYDNNTTEYKIIKPSNKKVLLKRQLEHRLINFKLNEETGQITY
jgi:hypothetical protein